MTLEEAVRRAIDNNLEIAVERLNPQTFDFTLASLRANYKPVATSTFGRRDNVRPPTNLLNPGSPNVSTMTYNSGITQNLRWGGGNMALTFNNYKVVSPTDRLASFDPQFNSSYLFAYTQPLLRGFKIDQTRQQMQTTVINRDNAELNLKARTTNTLAQVRSAYWDYVFYDPGGRRSEGSRSRSRRSCSRTTRFASKSARWRRWTSCRRKRKRPRGSRR